MNKVRPMYTDTRPNRPAKRARTISRSLPASFRIAFHTQEGMNLVAWHEIIRCRADGNYTVIYLHNESSIMVSKTLGVIEKALPVYAFVRVHQSHLTNVSMIRFVACDHVVMQDGTRIPVARSRRKTLFEILTKHTIEI